MVHKTRKMASSSANVVNGTDRRGKLSLKRKRNAENCGEDEQVVTNSSQTKRKSGGDGRETDDTDTDRFLKGQTSEENCQVLQARVLCHDSKSATLSRLSVPVVCNKASLCSSQRSCSLDQCHLPDLPAWYGLKKKEEVLQVSRTEVIKVGDVSIEWRPLPAHCHLCVVRSKQERAAEHQGRLCASAGAIHHIKREGSTENVKNIPNQLFPGDIKTEPGHQSMNPRMGAVSEDSKHDMDVKSGILQHKSNLTASSQTPNLPKPNLNHPIKMEGILHPNLLLKSQNDRLCDSKPMIRCESTHPLEDKKPQSLHMNKPNLSATKQGCENNVKVLAELKLLPSKKEKQDGMQRTSQKDSGIHAKVSSLSGTLSKDDQQSSRTRAKNSLGGLTQVIPIKSGRVESPLVKIKSNILHRISVKKVYPVSINLDDSSTISVTPMQTKIVLPPRCPKENLDLSEVIVLDSEDEEETQPSSQLTGFKRKLSVSSSDTDKRLCKKPKLIKISEMGTSGSPAARLMSRPKSPVPGYCDRQTKPGFVGQSKILQTTLDSMLVATSSGHTKMQPRTTSSNFHKSSFSKPFTAQQSPSVHSKQTLSSSLMQTKQLGATSSNTSAKKSTWNMSANVKPLFKKQSSEQLNSVQVLTKVESNSSKCNSSYPTIESQKINYANAKGMNYSRITHQSVLQKGDAATLSESPQEKMTGFTLPATNSIPDLMYRQPRNQSVFRLNKDVGPFEKLAEKPSTSGQQNANTRLHSEFQTARNIQTNQDMNPNHNIQPNTLWDNQRSQGFYPKQDSNYRDVPEVINRGINSDPNQHTNQGTSNSAAIQSCPLCGLHFPKKLTFEERDGHIALCLSASSNDVW